MQMTDASVLTLEAPAVPEAPLIDVPHVRIRPITQWSALDLGELWHFRELLTTLGIREVKLRYRQTALGAAWVVLQPLFAAGIFTIVFGLIAKMPSGDVPYFIFSYAGLLAWNAFANTLSKASTCLVGNASLISKVYFPRLILPFSIVLPTLIDFAVAMGMMFVLMFVPYHGQDGLIHHVWPGARILLLPVWLALVLLLGLSFGIYAAALMVRYRDVQHVLPVLIQLGFYATPVVYSLEKISKLPASIRPLFFLNPMSGLLEAFRWSLLGTNTLNLGMLAYSAVFAVVGLFLATVAFRGMERRFADVI
jgi:lipopolysaccharide transport system permease protein